MKETNKTPLESTPSLSRRDFLKDAGLVIGGAAVGSAAILSALNSGIKDFVLIGNLTLLPQCKDIYPMLEKLYGVHFHIPKYAEFCTAIGAALNYKQ